MMNSAILYEKDFYAWTIQHAQLLRERRLDELDIEHLAEEIEDVGLSEKRQLQHRLEVLIAHLLKLNYLETWKAENERGWRLTIKEQRRRIALCLKHNPSLKSYLTESVDEVYPAAVYQIVLAFNVEENFLPKSCPYSMTQILNNDFLF